MLFHVYSVLRAEARLLFVTFVRRPNVTYMPNLNSPVLCIYLSLSLSLSPLYQMHNIK